MYYDQFYKAMTKYKLFPITVKESFYGTAFRLSDRDNNGYITENEYNKMYRPHFLPQSHYIKFSIIINFNMPTILFL